MRTVFWYLHFVVTLILTTNDLNRMKRLKGVVPELELFSRACKIADRWALSQAKASGAKFNISGTENIPKDETVLFISNHQSNFDIAILMGYIDKPKGFIAKTELLKIPLLRTWMEYIGCVFMDRGDMKKSVQAIIDGINRLKSGYSMVVFPEGTRSKSDVMGEFKAGSFKLATKPKVTIIPVSINGSYKIMEANGNKIKPADVYITIHPPVVTRDLSKDEIAGLPARVKSIIASALPEGS